MKDQMNIHNDKGFEDIEQLLQPQCDFHASSQTKQQVIEKARKSLVSHHRREQNIREEKDFRQAQCSQKGG